LYHAVLSQFQLATRFDIGTSKWMWRILADTTRG